MIVTDKPLEILEHHLSKSIGTAFPAAHLRILARVRPFIVQHNKDRLPRQSQSFVLYQFTCTCSARYIGHTTRRLSKRIAEHCPASLRKGTVRNINSAILQHLVDSGHVIDPSNAFKPILTLPGIQPEGVRKRLLMTSEAIAIRIMKPELCKQRNLVQPLLLPWP